MSKLRCSITTSLDGYVAGPNQSAENPLGGGASVVQQYLGAGLIDELEIHIVPLLLGGGARLLDQLDVRKVKLEPIRTIEGPGVAHLKYRVVK